MPEPITDPNQVKVQLNAQVPFIYRQFLRELAATRRKSLNQLVVDALYDKYPMPELLKGPPDA